MFATLRRLVGLDPHQALRHALGDMQLPTFSVHSQAVLRALQDPETPMSRVGERLAADPGLSVRVLRLANRASNGLRRPITDAAHAARLLGREELESLVIAAVVRHSLPSARTHGFDPDRFWRSASLRASVARSLSAHTDPAGARVAFTASLLQDMAVPLLVQANPGGYREFLAEGTDDLEGRERARYGWDHAEVAGWVGAAWELPPGLVQAIAEHHEDHAPVALRIAPHALHEHDTEPFVEQARTHAGLHPERAHQLLRDAREHARELHGAIG